MPNANLIRPGFGVVLRRCSGGCGVMEGMNVALARDHAGPEGADRTAREEAR